MQCTSYYCGGAVNDIVGNDGPRFMTGAVGGLVVTDGCVDARSIVGWCVTVPTAV